LRDDAERVRDAQDVSPPIASLLERHASRQRRRQVTRYAAAAVVPVAIIAAWLASGLLQPAGDQFNPSGGGDEAITEAVPSVPEPIEPSRDLVPQAIAAEAPQETERGEGTPIVANFDTRVIPIMLVRTGADGEQQLVPGLYIPEHSESIDLSQLSEAQQRAVRKVLGLPKQRERRKPI
jgi:hypothetical protein